MRDWIWDTMEVALLAILVLGLLMAAGVCYAIGHRFLATWVDRRQLRRRSRYVEQAELMAAGEISPLQFVRAVPRRDYRLVEYLLLEIAAKFTGEVRGALAHAFAALGAIERNRRRLAHPIWWVRADGARRLGLMGSPEVGRSLHGLLTDSNVEVRIAAARSLLELGRSESLADLIPTLDRETAFSKLRLADVILAAGRQAVPALIQYVAAAKHPQGAAIAIDILGDMRALEAEPVIRLLLASSESIEVRAACCRAMGRFESPDAVEVLGARVSDPSWIVQAQAVRALGQIGDPAALPLMRHLLGSHEPWLVYNTAVALKRFGSPGEEALRGALRTSGGEGLLGQVAREVLGTNAKGG